jgi:UDP-glucose 4-epimerase
VKVLVTGHRGLVGECVVQVLTRAGVDWVGLDLLEGDDILDVELVSARATGCDAIVHLAAVEEDDDSDPVVPTAVTRASHEQVLATNIDGTRNVLAAAGLHASRVIYLSSVDVLGCFLGQARPRYYPIDDQHPTHPIGAYARSKLEGEDLCEQFTRVAGIPTVCLRPPGIFDESTYMYITTARAANPEFEWSPFWEYGAFIDVRDLADAVYCALAAGLTGHHRLLVCASDISSAHHDSVTLARRLTPEVPFRNPGLYVTEPFAALVDSTPARNLLDWHPRHRWRPGQTGR